jgi:hypothetical protein
MYKLWQLCTADGALERSRGQLTLPESESGLEEGGGGGIYAKVVCDLHGADSLGHGYRPQLGPDCPDDNGTTDWYPAHSGGGATQDRFG